jgi:SAM-dependent methyltransferase
MKHDFDIAAATYDEDFTQSKIGKIQREQVYIHLNELLISKKNMHVLELNCGTGEDANYISKHNHKVIATDISNEMMQVSKEKNSSTSVTFKQLDITKITNTTFVNKFDLIFSNFGGFNCLSKSEISSFLSLAPNLLNEKGKIVLVIMPKKTIWERFYFSIKGESNLAKRRNTSSFILADVQGIKVKTWYYNPSEIIEESNAFKICKTKPIGFFIPPSYLKSYFKNKKSILNLLKQFDRFLNWSFLSKYADHYYIELEKITNIK